MKFVYKVACCTLSFVVSSLSRQFIEAGFFIVTKHTVWITNTYGTSVPLLYPSPSIEKNAREEERKKKRRFDLRIRLKNNYVKTLIHVSYFIPVIYLLRALFNTPEYFVRSIKKNTAVCTAWLYLVRFLLLIVLLIYTRYTRTAVVVVLTLTHC